MSLVYLGRVSLEVTPHVIMRLRAASLEKHVRNPLHHSEYTIKIDIQRQNIEMYNVVEQNEITLSHGLHLPSCHETTDVQH